MVDRIEKLKGSDYWKIQGTADTKKDKRQSSEEEKKGNQESTFEEKPDFNRLIAKEPAKELGRREVHNFNIKDIQSIFFKGMTTGRDQASLEVDILLQDGSRQDSALISVSQAMGLKLVHHQPGEELPLKAFGKDPHLTAAVMLAGPPSKEVAFSVGKPLKPREAMEIRTQTAGSSSEERLEKALKLTRIVLYGIGGLLALTLVIWFFRWFL